MHRVVSFQHTSFWPHCLCLEYKYDLPQIKTVWTCWEDGQSSDTRPFFEDQILSSFCCCFYSSESLCHKGQKEVNAQTVTTFNEPTLNCRIALIFCKHFTLIARFIFWHLIFLFGCKERPTTCVKLTLHYCCLTFQIVWILIWKLPFQLLILLTRGTIHSRTYLLTFISSKVCRWHRREKL